MPVQASFGYNEMGNLFFSPLNPAFFHPALFFPPSTFLFHPLNLFFSPSNILFSPSTLSFLTLDPFFFTLLPLLGVLVGWLACCNVMQTKHRQPLGKTQGCVVLVDWFVGCLVGYQCKASIDSVWGKHSLVATLSLFIPFPLVGVLVGSACLACWSLGFRENTYSDGWIMDRETIKTYWWVGCLVCLLLIACVIQWMDGWMDAV